MSSPVEFIADFFSNFEAILDTFVYNGYQALADLLMPVVGSVVLLAVIFLGYRTMYGFGKMTVKEYIKFVVLVGVIYTFFFQWGNFSYYVVNFFYYLIDLAGSVLMQVSPSQISGASTLNEALQNSLSLIDYVGRGIFAEAGWSNLAYFFYGGIVYLTGVIMIAAIMLEIVLAKMIMAITFVLIPLIAPCLLFEKTKQIFDRWLGTLVAFSLLIIMISAVMGLFLTLVYNLLPVVNISQDIPADFYDGLAQKITPLFIVMIICIFLTFKIHQVAMNIGGGISPGSASGMAAAGAGAVVGYMGMSKAMTAMGLRGVGRVAGGTRSLAGMNGQAASGVGSQAGRAAQSQVNKIRS
jgi:type IV secretion system protein VirB6